MALNNVNKNFSQFIIDNDEAMRVCIEKQKNGRGSSTHITNENIS